MVGGKSNEPTIDILPYFSPPPWAAFKNRSWMVPCFSSADMSSICERDRTFAGTDSERGPASLALPAPSQFTPLQRSVAAAAAPRRRGGGAQGKSRAFNEPVANGNIYFLESRVLERCSKRPLETETEIFVAFPPSLVSLVGWLIFQPWLSFSTKVP